jgi:hypothetical protein
VIPKIHAMQNIVQNEIGIEPRFVKEYRKEPTIFDNVTGSAIVVVSENSSGTKKRMSVNNRKKSINLKPTFPSILRSCRQKETNMINKLHVMTAISIVENE